MMYIRTLFGKNKTTSSIKNTIHIQSLTSLRMSLRIFLRSVSTLFLILKRLKILNIRNISYIYQQTNSKKFIMDKKQYLVYTLIYSKKFIHYFFFFFFCFTTFSTSLNFSYNHYQTNSKKFIIDKKQSLICTMTYSKKLFIIIY